MGPNKGMGHLRRDIGIFGVGFLILNGLIGAGIYALPAALHEQAGIFSPWLFPIVGLLFITIILSFSELASYFKESGGPVLYNYTAFGPLIGFQTGWFSYLSRMAALAANTNVLIYYMAFLVPDITDGWIRVTTIIVIFSALAIGNILGIKGAIRILAIFSTLKLVPIFILILLGLPYVVPGEIIPTELPKLDGMGATILILIYAFMGFEGALITAGETDNPRRSVPRALIVTIIGITIFYFFVQLIYSSVAPQGTRDAPLVELGRVVLGSAGAIIITLTAISSIGGNLIQNMITVPRMTFAMAEEKTLPKWFGIIHAKYDTPVNSILFYSIVCAALAINGTLYMACHRLFSVTSGNICILHDGHTHTSPENGPGNHLSGPAGSWGVYNPRDRINALYLVSQFLSGKCMDGTGRPDLCWYDTLLVHWSKLTSPSQSGHDTNLDRIRFI